MRAIKSKVTKMERDADAMAAHDRRQDWLLNHRTCACLVLHMPGIERVRPDHTDPETYRHIQETLAWARGDYAEAERLRDLNPRKHEPLPPSTSPAERMRHAVEALNRMGDEAGERTERVREAIEAAIRQQAVVL